MQVGPFSYSQFAVVPGAGRFWAASALPSWGIRFWLCFWLPSESFGDAFFGSLRQMWRPECNPGTSMLEGRPVRSLDFWVRNMVPKYQHRESPKAIENGVRNGVRNSRTDPTMTSYVITNANACQAMLGRSELAYPLCSGCTSFNVV